MKTLEKYSQKKEALYREACLADPAHLHLLAGAEAYFDKLQAAKISNDDLFGIYQGKYRFLL